MQADAAEAIKVLIKPWAEREAGQRSAWGAVHLDWHALMFVGEAT